VDPRTRRTVDDAAVDLPGCRGRRGDWTVRWPQRDRPRLDQLAAQYPQIHYERGVRWVRDRNRMSSGSLTAGIDATLAAIDTLAGRDAATRAARATSYRHLAFLDDPTAALSRSRTGAIVEMAYRWERTTVAVTVGNDASESAIAALLDMYAATLTTGSVAVAQTAGVVITRHGVRLVPHDVAAHLADYDFITFATTAPAGVASYDAALAEVARTHGKPMARSVARGMNYPTDGLDLAGGIPLGLTMIVRFVALGLLGLLARRAILRQWRSTAQVSGSNGFLTSVVSSSAHGETHAPNSWSDPAASGAMFQIHTVPPAPAIAR
jgi:hypothetical protein